MGLDMYFGRKENGSTEINEVAYWRKANHIHNWFVQKVQNGVDECQESLVTREQMEELLAECKAVVENPSDAAEHLPTQSGFFFGGTEYDEYYMEDIKNTIEALERELAYPVDEGTKYYYQSSW